MLGLSPQGHLRWFDEPAADDAVAVARARAVFADGQGRGLLLWGAREVGTALPPVLAYWREVGQLFVTRLRQAAGEGGSDEPRVRVCCPQDGALARLAQAAPPMRGGEYLSEEVLEGLWDAMNEALGAALEDTGSAPGAWLAAQHAAWHQVGRVHLHLALNKADPERPFALLATYASRLSDAARAQHRPLGRAVKEHSERGEREALLRLLEPVARAAERSAWVRARLESRALFAPMRLDAAEAHRFLQELPELEAAGLVVRLPEGWLGRRPARAQVRVTVGSTPPGGAVGMKALLQFSVEIAVDGEPLTLEEREAILRSTDGLVLLRGRWVEVDSAKLAATLARYEAVQARAARDGIPFAEALRMVAGANLTPGDGPDEGDEEARWSEVVAGPWMAEALARLRGPDAADDVPIEGLRATLRPYQRAGVSWLRLLCGLGLGGCLADDMGLGKTIQIIALFLRLRQEGAAQGPHLLVVPASLLGNWRAELARFAPELAVRTLHPSELRGAALRDGGAGLLDGVDVAITTYSIVARLSWLAETRWHVVVLDEAQAIKNPSTRQARAVKKLEGRARIALTGTPVENRLGDLWSLFDFANPGLLGSARTFDAFVKRLAKREHHAFAPLRELVRPYLLRRLKTDRSILADLPDKVEVKAWCGLSKLQATLYQQTVDELTLTLPELDGVARRGVVLATLMRLKQICNHPSQWLGDDGFAPSDSGKWARLGELAETVRERQDKMLVFTQFRSLTGPLAAYLGGVFGREGLELHGGTAVRARAERVEAFQREGGPPFMVLSIKAGGTGLNLTAASHVVHFDRWWNPAVENQATDRAFRIGQTRNVLVHKLVCRGTVEEQIDAMIEAKSELARDVLEGGVGARLTELSNDDLLRVLSLDVHRAAEED